MVQYKMVDLKGTTILTGVHRYRDLTQRGQQNAREELAREIVYDYKNNPIKYARTNYKTIIEGVAKNKGGHEETVRVLHVKGSQQIEKELRKRDRFYLASGGRIKVRLLPNKKDIFTYTGLYGGEEMQLVRIILDRK